MVFVAFCSPVVYMTHGGRAVCLHEGGKSACAAPVGMTEENDSKCNHRESTENRRGELG